jgi:amino acid adenylation domain-containing protein
VLSFGLRPQIRFVPFEKDEIAQSVPERFEKQVVKYPDHVAVKTVNKQLTYTDFNQVANRLARAILQQKSGANDPVALLFEHDTSAIVAIFGALKAGECFVPLDPSLPRSRLKYMLDDSGARLIITDHNCLAAAKDLLDGFRRVIDIQGLDPLLAADNLELSIFPEDKSCILYTSGTTGKPKGVVHTHQNELHNVMHHTNSLYLSADDGLTLLGSYSTGQGMQDFYCALLNGATLYPWSLKAVGLNGLAEWLKRERITVYHSAATVYRYLIRHLSEGFQFSDVRIVRLGSEAVYWKDVELYRKHFSDHCVFVNALSSSETKTIRQYVLSKDTRVTGRVPIGYAVPDMDIFLLDDSGNVLSPNEWGEIAVRSRYLSPGYWRSPDLTGSAYHLDTADSELRTFRTGEWGRISTDGCLEHFGRRDDQVKIRGYRIEIHEAELALLQHPAVDYVLVLCLENFRGDRYLAAYIVIAGSFAPTVSELRIFLNGKIPDYMIPSVYVFMESLPLTPNGKVDRNALPKPSTGRPVLDVQFVAPRDSIEKELTELWTEILGIDEIGVYDNHFDLGGNSLTAMQVCAQVEKLFKISISLRQFFESPTIASVSAAISAVCRTAGTSSELRLEPCSRSTILPLSFAQQRLWFLDQWAPGNPVYNVCEAHRLKGRLDLDALEKSLNEVVQRHEILRTTFPVLNDQPTQTIEPALRLKLAIIDMQARPEIERHERSLDVAGQEARRPFDLARGPLLRVAVVRLAEDEHLLLFTLHQIVCDGWSMQIFRREFRACYDAFSEGRIPSLPPLSLQYVDFAMWQHRLLQEDVLRPQVSFWRSQLGRQLPILNIPADHARPARQNFRGGKVFFVVPKGSTAALNELSREEGVTLFMTLLAAFKILLHRYSGQEELAVGFPVANRNLAETGNLIGFCVNTLVARSDLSGDPTVKEFLKRVRDVCLGAFAHQDLPFERVVQEVQPPRDSNRNPLFEVMFAFQNIPLGNLRLTNLISTSESIDSGTSKFDLTLSLAERDKMLVGFFEYSSELFERHTIERMVSHFQTLMRGLVADRHLPISKLPLLAEAERRQLLIGWNDTYAQYPKDTCLHELFETQAAKTPESIAFEFEAEKLTFRELNSRANQLARHLRGLGIGREMLVGLCMERSLEMVVGVLGILKAGGAYVPLDPAYPDQRLEFMSRDACLAAIVTREGFVPRLQHYGGSFVCVDNWDSIATQSDADLNNESAADGAAYVIYTSGSTGIPKGVVGLHRGTVNRLAWMWKKYPFAPNERCCLKTSLSFVDSLWEIFGPLLQGIPTTIISDDEVKDVERLISILAERHVSRIVLVPSLLDAVLEAVPDLRDHLPDLKYWSSSGETLRLETLQHFRQSLPDSILLNLYGSSEISADVTWSDMRDWHSGGPITIGRPIANTQIFVLDSQLQPVPIGVHGEIFVGGDGLARGYLNRAELTEEKFIPNPFNGQQGSHLYRTGDRGRFLADGTIEFLGRVDNQVKIRGYRIELGEIESTLNKNQGVRESVVVVRNRESRGEMDLVGYFVPRQESKLSVTELRSFLREKLPDYMIPSVLVVLDELPLMPNGKVDRNALPPADGKRPDIDQGFVAPRNELEELVAQVWLEVLELDKIGIRDNFFELGGHSLLATRIVARLCAKLSIDLSLRRLFEFPTVAVLAQHIDDLLHNQSGSVTPPIVPVRRDQLIPASFSQQRLWFLRQLDPDSTAYNISSIFSIRGTLEVHTLERALNTVIARHEILRTTFEFVEGSLVQNIRSVLGIVLPVTNLEFLRADAREAKAREIAVEKARIPFDLCKGPLLLAQLLKVDEEKYYLLLNLDHTILDGWSMGTLFKELGVLYQAFANREPNPLPPLAVQYADYTVWQQEYLRGDGLESQVEYWRRQVGSFSPLSLPTDYPRPTLQTARGGRKTLPLSSQLTNSLKKLSRREGVTLFMTLLAAFKILLFRYSGQEDVVVGSTIAGRSRPEIEGLIGFFINALPLRTDLSGKPSFLELLKRVREVCLGAYTHQDLPFEKIVEAINPNRDLSRNPLFQIMFNMADVSERVLQLAGCEVIKESFFDPEAKFDLTLYAPEKAGAIELAIVYNADLFSELRTAAMLEQFRHLLSQIAEKPQVTIGEYSLAVPSTLVFLPDPTEFLDDSWEGPIHAYVTEWAERARNRIAVVDADETWTYGELDARSNQLAYRLIARGIQPKDTVAIFAHRSAPSVLALLGVLKAGAAFVILDPAYPAARLSAYLRVARPKGWIHMDAAGELAEEIVRCLDTLDLSCRVNLPVAKQAIADLLREQPESQPCAVVGANDPAYIAFTSGSTGEPKGVLSRHGPITHFLPWQKDAFDLRETDRFCMLSGLAYNHLHRDIFTSIYLGASLHIPEPEKARDPVRLMEWLEQNEITILHLTPALGQLLLTAGERTVPFVRRVFFGGDVLTKGEIVAIHKCAPNAKIGSFYGATETQRAVGYYEIPEDFSAQGDDGTRAIPLGRGIKDVQLLVLNSAGQLAGVGEIGELYLRSPHLAEGYIGDEELTRHRFLINPFTNRPNDRLYRTGELGRYLPNGNVEWAGRNDRQVNIRGFRVELAEIETVLKQHPAVKNAAVVARELDEPNPDNLKSAIENPKSETRLFAYVAAEQDGPEFIDLLRSFLSAKLPDYMVPAHFRILEGLPFSPNGKIDYQALPLPIQSPSSSAGSFDAPQTEIEQKLSQIFAQVLGREKVGMNENFFRLGGHSLLAAQAAARIREVFGVELELRAFLEAPVVAAIAKQLALKLKARNTMPTGDDTDREEIEL